ncbi:class I adenylate-forming enzyme family protein [Rhodoligotrophos defluvii]|uniref:class I adenylate-forming enzyme family protein n=1 Tax=Rhodoligotrophos defluvii TaxID=2561934 RepID=UPI0019614C60|nr:class I adenylate-forming enzyme family protein [Rhodoligotrophos defluvii]
MMLMPQKSLAIRREVHYGTRLVRCFADRPAHIDALFRETVARFPETTALVLGDERIDYRSLDETVERVAANLAAHGLGKGDRIALLLGNAFPFVFMVLAAARIGAIIVPMNIRQRRPEIAFMLNQCTAAALVYDAEHAANLPAGEEVPALRHVFVVGAGPGTPFSALLAAGSAPAVDIGEEDVFSILYTSGTTGRPKGAMLTHFSTVHSVIHYREVCALRPGDVSIMAVPASHVTGLVANILTMVLVGGTTVIMPAFKARAFLELAERERLSFTILVPAMYNLCLLDPDFAKFDLSAWRVAGFGGAPMPRATIERLAATCPNMALVNCYGSTETSSPSTILPPGHIKDHPTSVGKPVHCADIVVVDEQGREVAPGESGELLIGGPMVVPGYWDNPDATAAGFVNGFWRSGDVGAVDEQGYVYVFDRKKDMINRGGFKVYCIEVESVLSHHPSVVESAVVGAPCPVLGERVHAFIYAGDRPKDEAGIKAFCAERLSDYKVPDYITFLDEPLPRNANGKVLKTALRSA